jgi:hypothetical protein
MGKFLNKILITDKNVVDFFELFIELKYISEFLNLIENNEIYVHTIVEDDTSEINRPFFNKSDILYALEIHTYYLDLYETIKSTLPIKCVDCLVGSRKLLYFAFYENIEKYIINKKSNSYLIPKSCNISIENFKHSTSDTSVKNSATKVVSKKHIFLDALSKLFKFN